MPSYSEFKKQAWGVLGTEGDFSASLPKPTPEQKAHNDMLNEAFNEGFIEGGAGALAGDGYRGVARGALNTAADTVDSLVDAPVRTAYMPAMVAGKGITWLTGNDKAERVIRALRNITNAVGNFPMHMLTGATRDLANSKALDPKYLTPEAYQGAVDAGTGGVILADLAISSKLPAKLVSTLAGMEIADAVSREASAVEGDIKANIAAAKRQASHDAMVDYFKKKTQKPAGPIVAWAPELKDTLWNQIAVHEAEKDPEGRAILDQIDADREKLDYQKALKQLKQLGKQTAGAGIGGALGLTAAHQITKRIPYLKKRKMLRYLINMIGAGGAGYAGWKLMGK